MLDDSTKTTIRTAFEKLKASRPGFRARASQNRMIRDIARVAGHDEGMPRHLVVEAPTGTGKSLAYLLGAVPAAMQRGKKVVIATNTVALQSQLLDSDIPSLNAQAGLSFRAKLGKGRNRYACPQRLAQFGMEQEAQAALGFGSEDEGMALWDRPPTEEQRQAADAMQAALTTGRWDGDLDAWAPSTKGRGKAMPEGVIPLVTATRVQCAGQQCAFYAQCPYFKARAALRSADVQVVNMNLLLADLDLGGGVILSDPAETIYVIDEAHHVAAKAVEQFARHIDLSQIRPQLQRGRAVMTSAAELLGRQPNTIEDLQHDLDDMRQRFTQVASMLDPLRAHATPGYKPDQPIHVLLTPELSGSLLHWVTEAKPSVDHLVRRLANLIDDLAEAVEEKTVAVEAASSVTTRLAWLHEVVQTTQEVLALLLVDDADVPSPMAKWLEWAAGGQGALRLCASPISAAARLKEQLWDRADAVILTSATLTSLGTFDAVLAETGLDPETTGVLQLASPFDLEKQAELRVVGGAATRERNAEHTREVVDAIETYQATTGGTLALFTSHAQLRAVYDGLSPDTRSRVLRQGDQSRDALLAEHARRIASGKPSILFGVQLLSEGLDLPRELLRSVIVAKLPFAVPDHPIERTREQWIKARGGDYFNEVVVPEAQLRLTQMTGRLIRTADDEGVIVIVDRRLTTTRYGKRMLDTLPPYRRVG
jgi:ATP-dependent DNA helicase DinG